MNTKINIMDMTAPYTSPWGEVQWREEILTGVFTVSTAGHGGIMVHRQVAKNILSNKAMQAATFKRKDFFCYEEDCDAVIVLLELYRNGISLQTLFSPSDRTEQEYVEGLLSSLFVYNRKYFEKVFIPKTKKTSSFPMFEICFSTSAFQPYAERGIKFENAILNDTMKVMDNHTVRIHSISDLFAHLSYFVRGDVGYEKRNSEWEASNIASFNIERECYGKLTVRPTCPDFKQGYCNVGKYLTPLACELAKETYPVVTGCASKSVEIPFSAAYDSRQYNKRMDGCKVIVSLVDIESDSTQICFGI